MIFLYWYLLSVSFLSFFGYITIDIFLTLALALTAQLLFSPFTPKNFFISVLKKTVLFAAAVALLWKESFLPSPGTLVGFIADETTRPTTQYMLSFLKQFINLWMLAGGLVLFALTFQLSRKKPVLLFFVSYLLAGAAWLLTPKSSVITLPEASPETFYQNESRRIVEFPRSINGPAFDIIILHICSLSWKDLKDADADIRPFFSKFDYVFTDFSSGCSYSGPSALRVLKSSCGQLPHTRLYADSPPGCYLMDNLRALGYKTYTTLNSDGKYADFAGSIQKYGHADAPLDIAKLPITYRMFDGTPMLADDASLLRFWEERQASKVNAAALYYNTSNLHIGTYSDLGPKIPDDNNRYRQRLNGMLDQMESFFGEIERSGRNAVVIFVPEHGAALSGSKMQAKDVREIPLPSISILPAGVRLIGKTFKAQPDKAAKIITKPVGLQAMSWLIAEFLRNNPYSPQARSSGAIAKEIPVTEFMAENENSAVKRMSLGYIYRVKNGKWMKLPAYASPQPGEIPTEDYFSKSR